MGTTEISQRLFGIAILVLSALSMSADTYAQGGNDRTVSHTVVFWFKPGTDPATVDAIINEVKSFESLPMVRKVYVGRPLMSDREVVDDSFDIAFTLIFDNEERLHEYESDRYHLRVSQENIMPHVIRGVIYDTIE